MLLVSAPYALKAGNAETGGTSVPGLRALHQWRTARPRRVDLELQDYQVRGLQRGGPRFGLLLVTPDPWRGALESPRKAEVRIG